MYTVVHYTAMHFQGPQSTWGALAVYKVTHVGSLHVYCSTLLCTFRWTQRTWGALAVYKVTHVGSLRVYCSTLLCKAGARGRVVVNMREIVSDIAKTIGSNPPVGSVLGV